MENSKKKTATSKNAKTGTVLINVGVPFTGTEDASHLANKEYSGLSSEERTSEKAGVFSVVRMIVDNAPVKILTGHHALPAGIGEYPTEGIVVVEGKKITNLIALNPTM